MLRAFASLVTIVALLAASPSLAAPKKLSSEVEAAKAHYAAGEAFYEQRAYSDAAREFSEAYRLSHRVDLLYNVSLAYEKLGQWDEAIASLEQYVNAAPDAVDLPAIKARLEDLKARKSAAAAPVESAAPQLRTMAFTRARAPGWWVPGTVVGGVAALALITAVGTGTAADGIRVDLMNRCMNFVCSDSERDSLQRGKNLAIATDVLIAVGGAAALTSVVLFAVKARPRAARRASFSPYGVGLRF